MPNIGLTAVDSRWFGATSLRLLDLSGNKLGKSDSFETKFLNIVRLQQLKVLVLANNEIQSISVNGDIFACIASDRSWCLHESLTNFKIPYS